MLQRTRTRRFDYTIPICAFALCLLGVLAIYSATHGDDAPFARKQLLWMVLFTPLAVIAALIDYRVWVRLNRPLYVFNLCLLLAVLASGQAAKGAQRWIDLGFFRLQPSEIAKVMVIICLATYASNHRASLRDFWGLCKSFLFILPPMLLILKQPDLGTSLVLIAVWFGITWVAGARGKHLAIIAISGLLAFTALWHVGFIKDYQKQRLVSFLDPAADPLGSGWHTIQSKIAIGSGGLTGRGLLHGTQSQGGFIPEQHTDFVNTVIGEELGFMGSSFLLFLFFLLIYRAAMVAANCGDTPGRLIATGIVSMLTFHVFVNLGMTVHIMPVTGVPLPFLSYGGSSLMLNLIAIGLLVSIDRRREAIRF